MVVRRGTTLSSPLRARDRAVMEEGRGRSEAYGELLPVWLPAGPAAFHTRLSSIHSFRAGRTPQRMRLGLDPSVLPSLHRLEDFTDAVYWE